MKEQKIPVVIPVGDRILVEVEDVASETSGGILLPDTAKEKPSKGKVITVGPGRRREDGKLYPVEVKVGATILFTKWAGTEADEVLGKGRRLINEQDVLAVIHE